MLYPTRATCSTLLTLLVAVLPARADDPPDLSGSWELDESESDEPLEEIMDAMNRGSSRSGWDPRREGERKTLEELVRYLAEGDGELRIEQTADTVTVTKANDTTLRILTDGTLFQRPIDRYESLDATARWTRKGRLEIEAERDLGGRLFQTFDIDKKTELLEVTTRMSGWPGSPNMVYTRVYERKLFEPPGS